MFDKGRIVATCIYLVSIGLTLWAALHVRPMTLQLMWYPTISMHFPTILLLQMHNIILTLLFLIIQLAALLW